VLTATKGVFMADGIITLTSANFDETVKSSTTPILVDFWAEWCGPCKAMNPVLAEIAKEQVGNVIVAKLNVDEHGEIAQRFNVMSIPTMILFKDGEMQKQVIGAKGKSQLLAWISEFTPIKN